MDQSLVVADKTPSEVVNLATQQATILMDIVTKTKCFQTIGGKDYLQVEAWETIGAFNRTHAETESIIPIVAADKTIGYQAHVQLWKDGQVVGGAIMPCYFTENCCKGKEGDAKHKASMSAAQTFATSKAYRMNYSYVAILAGYQPLPAEEITDDMRQAKSDTGEHWCEEHQTNFFKAGRMKWFAHKIEGTDKWCSETNAKKKPVKEEVATADLATEPAVAPAAEEERPTRMYDPEEVAKHMGMVFWKDATAKSWIKTKFQTDTTGTMTEVLDRLGREQLAGFLTEIQDRLGML